MFRKEKSGRHSKSQNAAVRLKEIHHKRRRKFVSPLDGAERSVRLTSLQRPKCPDPTQGRQVKDGQCLIRKDPRLTLSNIKEVKKMTYSGYGSSSDRSFIPGSVTSKPDFYADIPNLQCKLKGKTTASQQGRMVKSVNANNIQGYSDKTVRTDGGDENASNAISSGNETDNIFEDDEEADDDDEEEDEEDIDGMPQAVRAMTQIHVDAYRPNKDVIDIHKRRMESLARNISSTRLTKHLATEGYFNYDYSRHARVGYVSHTARRAKKKMAGKTSCGKKQTDCV
ncbi:hypothetical protein Btru_052874 [Bulinus truncatus]|nr:hypothetical protein Btru_052874 [Bulinus truncatus]